MKPRIRIGWVEVFNGGHPDGRALEGSTSKVNSPAGASNIGSHRVFCPAIRMTLSNQWV
jgi:hypothetical protein